MGFSKALIPQKSETICFLKKRISLETFEKNWVGKRKSQLYYFYIDVY